ncbi:hypothetical protein EV187_2563 [Agromyces ramosus]|uniref:SpaA-like prealbumin fold domain-containing protein n=1 Tax=Agromyces ramosus TaxID=33879 RepID=A0A4Q7MAD4_9MICO|nr:prealbumin-like fold domain-containing protein [Agromyces ramosus]RZS64183.1 hypothetical protein EV187_2563 [Agromyces ramosus]
MPFLNRPRADLADCPPPERRRSRIVAIAAAGALVLTGVIAAGPAQASHPEVSLPNSNFEIEPDANLKLDDAAPSIDWASVAETRKADAASGTGDDSFGQGSKEDTPVPSVVSGSIPPNKSDLKNFGTYFEDKATGDDFLHMFWHRVQDPTGTTNMDFEFNQSRTLSSNGVTPVRSTGDLLIQYDLANGGTVPELFLSRWVTTGAGSLCEAANATPCWGDRVNLSAAGIATGSINLTAIPNGESDGLGPISARTFGEASVNFTQLTGGGCTPFGSAYLKSRSSDSFTAAMKDFIAPAAIDLNTCATVIIRKQTNPDEAANTSLFDFSKSFATQPASVDTFSLADDGVKSYTGTVPFGAGYTVSENLLTMPTGYEFDNVNCSASTGVTPVINGETVTFAIDASSDVLDCTYTNAAKGTIIVEKETSDGFGTFAFTSATLPDTAFDLTTTAPGAAGKDSESFSDLTPGTYDVAETVPANWNLTSATCDDGSDPASIDLSAGETVTCKFVNARERGAILITKTAKHADDPDNEIPHAGVTFTVTGNGIPAGTTAVTDANGQACVGGLLVSDLPGIGAYTVTETVPAGYHVISTNPQTAWVSESEADCDPITPGASLAFENMPLTNLTVSVDSQIVGGTSSTIDCVPGLPDPDFTTPASGDGSLTLSDLEPQLVVCSILIDP